MQFINRVNANTKKTVITFFLSGLLVGTGAGWLVTQDYPQEFWFDKTDKFLMPNWHYWLLEGVGFLITMLIACLLAYFKNWIRFAFANSFARLFLAVLMTLALPFLLIKIESQGMPGETYFFVDWLLTPACSASLISFTLWLFTAKFYKKIYGLMLAISVCILPAANALFFIPANLLNGDSKNFELVLFALAYASLASVCGYWLAKAHLERSSIRFEFRSPRGKIHLSGSHSRSIKPEQFGLLVLPDGSMLITDDGANKIWRVTYAKGK